MTKDDGHEEETYEDDIPEPLVISKTFAEAMDLPPNHCELFKQENDTALRGLLEIAQQVKKSRGQNGEAETSGAKNDHSPTGDRGASEGRIHLHSSEHTRAGRDTP